VARGLLREVLRGPLKIGRSRLQPSQPIVVNPALILSNYTKGVSIRLRRIVTFLLE